MNIKAPGWEGRVMLCGSTACPKMYLDAARPVITRYGVCSLIDVMKLPAVAEHYGSSPCSQNPLNPRSLALFLFVSVFVSSSNLVQSLAQLFNQYHACYAIRIPLPCSQEQGSGPEAGFAGSHLPILFVVISVSIIAFHGRSCIS
jgi:hypothetical protein